MRSFLPAAILASFVLSGCESQRVHDLYDGSDAEAAQLQAFDTVQISHIDAREQSDVFVGQQHAYQIAPGKHTVVLEYADFFQLDADRHEKVVSAPVKMVFSAEPGKTYRIAHAAQPTVEAARSFAKAPELQLLEMPSMRPVEAVFERSLPTSFLPKLRFENTPAYGFVSESGGENVESAKLSSERKLTDTLGVLKQQWEAASPEERKAFRSWIDGR